MTRGTYGGRERCIQILFGRLDGKRPRGKCGHRWDDIIKMDLKIVELGGMDCIVLV